MKIILLAVILLNPIARANDLTLKNVQFKGWGFIRNEAKENADYKKSLKDKTEFTHTRINFSLQTDLAENYGYVFLAPQFSKISGQEETVNPGHNEVQTSGGLSDSRLDMHEAYFALKPTRDERFYLFAGRQELNYGDHLIVGTVPWHRIGRSFDGARFRYKPSEILRVDAFIAKLDENNAAATDSKKLDSDFSGIYLSLSPSEFLKEADLYLLKKSHQQTGDFHQTNAYGLRLKSPVGSTVFDYRAEGTLEQVQLADESSLQKTEYQVDLEVGYKLPWYSARIALEYFWASRNYDQLFPTAHKFLGYADQFSRRNIKGQVVHFSIVPFEKFSLLSAYHLFKRHDTGQPAYDFAGNGLGTVGGETSVARELDLVAAYDFTKTLQLSAGHSWVTAGPYLKDQGNGVNAETKWSYLQLLVRF